MLPAVLASLLATASAQDGEAVVLPDPSKASLSFTNDFEFRYQNFNPTPLIQVEGTPPPKFFEEVNRFTARAGVKDWGFNVQVDQVAFVGAPYLLDGERTTTPPDLLFNCGLDSCVENPFGDYFYANPEKFAVKYTGDDLKFTVGDFYAAFGYGAAVNLNRNVDIDVDSSIQGVRVVGTPGKFELTGLAGMLNRQQVFADNPNFATLQGDLRHLIGGVRLVRHELGPASLGVHGVVYNFTQQYGLAPVAENLGTPIDVGIAGATLELYGVAGIDWQFEADVASFPTDADGRNLLYPNAQPEPGHSLYGSAQFLAGPTVWQVDFKKYKNFQRINRPIAGEQYLTIVPPTLEYERAINFNTAAAVGSDDIWGGRVRMDLALGQVTPYVAVSAFRDSDLENAAQHAPSPENIISGLTGVEVLFDDVTVLANAMARGEIRDGDGGRDAQFYGDLDVKFPLPGKAHADLIVFGQRFLAGPESEEFGDLDRTADWTEASFSLTVAPNHVLGVTGYFDYTTNPAANNGGNLGNDALFGAVEAYLKPSSNWTIRAFHGGYASGIRCSGGQCRFVPAFTGTRLAVTGTF